MRSRKLQVLTVIAAVAIAAFVFVWRDYKQFTQTPVQIENQGMSYTLKQGMGLARFSADLYDLGVIRSLAYFRWMAQQSGDIQNIRVGEYFFPVGITPMQILQKVQRGDVVQHSFTIIEGWNLKTVLLAVLQRKDIQQTLDPQAPKAVIASQLAIDYPSAEGWLLPETYFFTLGMTDQQILKRAAAAMKLYLEKAWENRASNLLLKTPYEALILASLIEKETGQANERKEISGVFHRRLKKRMRLETDPTIIYGMGDAYHGNIRKKDLRKDTPYNTYTRHGLPPTPIAMPSAAAIDAALHPAEGSALYFVAKGDGSHVFSSNFSDHLTAVRRYQLRRRHAK